jgi:dTDP-4-amino-4,6-dideoxygalactose transaminase
MQKFKSINYLDFKKEASVRGEEYLSAVKRVINSGKYVLSSEVLEFEKKFAKYIGVKYCVGVANGLEAIQISLMALGIGSGDEVITTPVSAVATTLAILAVGAKPVFADVDKNGQIDVNQIEKLITKKTKAILPVYLYGQPLAVDQIKNICNKHKLFLIEDAAQAHGATFKGKTLGSFGDISCFSFYPTKNVGAIGDGGAVATNDKKLMEACSQIRDYGQSTKYVHTRFGLNSRLDELQAAILSVKLSYLDEDNQKRREIAKKYILGLSKIKEIKLILPSNINDSNFHLFVIRTKERDELKKYLEGEGIPSLIHYPITIPDQPMFEGKFASLKIPEARALVNEVLSLPCNPFFNIKDVELKK